MKKIYLTITKTYYYGDQICFTYSEDKDDDVEDFQFLISTKEECINCFKELIKQVPFLDSNAHISIQMLYDLIKLFEDRLLGDDMYNNFIQNLEYFLDNNLDINPYCPCYSSGNEITIFEENSGYVFWVKPLEKFKMKVKEWYLNKKYLDIDKLKQLFPEDFSDEEKNNELLKEKKKTRMLGRLTALLEESKNQLANYKKIVEELEREIANVENGIDDIEEMVE